MKWLLLLLALSDIDALNGAKYLWGEDAWIKKAGRNFQIGCVYQGTKLIVATSKLSWEDAFSKVDLRINGPRMLGASARDEVGNVGEATPVRIYLCNPSR